MSDEQNININTRITAEATTDLVDIATEIAANTKKMSDLFTTQRTAVNNMGFSNRLQMGSMGQNAIAMRQMQSMMSRGGSAMRGGDRSELWAAGAGFLLHGGQGKATPRQASSIPPLPSSPTVSTPRISQIPSFPASYSPFVKTLPGDFRQQGGAAAGTGTFNLGSMFAGAIRARRERQRENREAMEAVAGGDASKEAWLAKRAAARSEGKKFETAPIPGAVAFQHTAQLPMGTNKDAQIASKGLEDKEGSGWASKLASVGKGVLAVGSAIALIGKKIVFPGTASIGRNMEFYNEKMREGMSHHPMQWLQGQIAKPEVPAVAEGFRRAAASVGPLIKPGTEKDQPGFIGGYDRAWDSVRKELENKFAGPHGLPGLGRLPSQFNKEDDESHKSGVGAGVR